MTRVRIDIERLVLRGVSVGDRAAFARALEASLARALGDPATLDAVTAAQAQPGRRPSLDAGSFALPAAAGGAEVGRAAAQAIVKGLSR